MKGLNKWMMLLVAGVLLVGFASCSKDDDGATISESEIQGEWQKMLPEGSKMETLKNYELYDYYKIDGNKLMLYRPSMMGVWSIANATIEIDGDMVFYKLNTDKAPWVALGHVAVEGEKLLVTVDSKVLEKVSQKNGITKETEGNEYKEAGQGLLDFFVNTKFYLVKATIPEKPEKKAESEEE
ncbi:MAG: hypothetical protein CSA97_01160 [Bacteroidetes bacterium]|nr:MAG: hypothetical protein CSA97_01160 [Bacteroidota bacterium]